MAKPLMVFDAEKFKSACHTRAMNVAVVAMAKPFKAAIITEHCAAFPEKESECYVQIVLSAAGRTFDALQQNDHFSISFLPRSDLALARAIYTGNLSSIVWKKLHAVPYVESANAAILCSVEQKLTIGPTRLIVGHAFRAAMAGDPKKPLVNYLQNFCSVNDELIPVHDPSVSNPRLDSERTKPSGEPPPSSLPPAPPA